LNRIAKFAFWRRGLAAFCTRKSRHSGQIEPIFPADGRISRLPGSRPHRLALRI